MSSLSPEDARQLRAALRPFEDHERLCEATAQMDLVEMKRLLALGTSTNLPLMNRHRGLPMHEAAACGFIEGLECLLAAGADIDVHSQSGSTPLATAARYGQVEAGRWLIRHGADARASTKGRESVLYSALSSNHLDFASMMLAECPDLRDNDLITSAKFLMPSDDGHLELAQWLLNAGVSPDLVTDDGETWLMEQRHDQDAMFKLLLAAGANPNLKSPRGETPLHLAVDRGQADRVLLLLRAGANPDIADNEDVTPRQRIMDDGSEEMVEAFTSWQASEKARKIMDRALTGTMPRPL